MKIRKAVVPIAGLGTRLFPASHACKKEFFPIVGPDGIARPLVHYQIMDLIEAGIEQICIIVRPGEEQLVINYLQGPGESYLKRLEKYPDLAQEAKKMQAALDRISFAVQEFQEGYGHAVYQSKKFANGDPILLCLGDHLFQGDNESCHSQLIQAYRVCGGKSVSAVNYIYADDLKGYGTIAGKRQQARSDLIDVSLIIEKPSLAVAKKKLRVDGLQTDEFLGWFGMHALSPSIYDILEEAITQDIRQKGEIQLTYAQELQRQREGYCALEMKNGKRFDDNRSKCKPLSDLPRPYATHKFEEDRLISLSRNNLNSEKPMKTSIILPTYKEKDNIGELIQAIFATLQPLNIDFDIVVVDDNSPDGTAEIVRKNFSKNGQVKLFVRTEERGLATAIRYGIEHSESDILVFMDTDFNHDPIIIPQMIKFLEYYDIIIGSRFVMAGGMEDRFRQFASRIYNYGIRLLFGTPVHDNLSGFFSIYREKLEAMNPDQIYYGYGDYFIRLLMVAHKRGYQMLEIPVFYRLRMHGHSKTQFLSTFARYTQALLTLRLKLWTGKMQ